VRIKTKNLNDEEYSEHMDRLVIRMARMLDGEDYFDAASANAALIAYALKELYPSPGQRMMALDRLVEFIKELWEVTYGDESETKN